MSQINIQWVEIPYATYKSFEQIDGKMDKGGLTFDWDLNLNNRTVQPGLRASYYKNGCWSPYQPIPIKSNKVFCLEPPYEGPELKVECKQQNPYEFTC